MLRGKNTPGCAPETPESAVAPAVALVAPAVPPAQAATLNLVQQVQDYRFNPDRYQDFDAGNSGVTRQKGFMWNWTGGATRARVDQK